MEQTKDRRAFPVSLPPRSRPRTAGAKRPKIQSTVFGVNPQRINPEEVARIANEQQNIQVDNFSVQYSN